MGWEFDNMLATIGAFILAISVLVFLINIFKSIRAGLPAGPDPWDSRTLEWAIPSPPPIFNFERLPIVRSRDPLWGLKYGRQTGSLKAQTDQEDERVRAEKQRPALEWAPADQIHVPPKSIFPFLVAFGILVAGVGMMDWYRVSFIGLAIVLLSIIGMGFEHPTYGQEEHGQTSDLDNRKMGIWVFLGSESIFFASLIATYLVYKGLNRSGPTAGSTLEIPLVSFTTFVLLMSSLAMVLALTGIERGSKWGKFWLFVTPALGTIFLLGQVYEFTHFYNHGLALQTNLFSETFYTLVGFHGAHVTIGVIWLFVLAIAGARGKLPASRSLAVDVAALYWHFVDVVWIVIFSVIYLMKDVPS
jgi:cytochrome c oxidase subunit 3/cytochrome o ubiquinol oxidase subunit 3